MQSLINAVVVIAFLAMLWYLVRLPFARGQRGRIARRLGLSLLVLLLASAGYGPTETVDPPAPAQDATRAAAPAPEADAAGRAAVPAERTAAECREDLQCWAAEHEVESGMRCRDAVEALARFDFEWTDGFLEAKFPLIRWADKAAGDIVFMGDLIRFQNGFGAMERHKYWCTYSPATGTVIRAEAAPGHF